MRYGRRNQYPGNGPFRDLPSNQRPGYLYGGGRSGYTGTDPKKCARFPWLQRWWWTNPADNPEAINPHTSPASETEFLEGKIDFLNNELKKTNKRLEEISEIEQE